ncbi:hypothetical protein JNUCC1_00516 [Lentibacillus sp. JNUCC-1]|uniref:efflux RND transporter periplasmic adaptor subunit n=1 Tax=Lentibacillus sp. JNUCC-1 TaxID=2654513 RepID=UPI0012E912A9|nr:efflux RND transporter periplasmic adaptor subunit [Lentibacillus sp. JNUCC-1]MUV36712.1 hypothetical protein [Lentibacillus sp. JNUCC-1]
MNRKRWISVVAGLFVILNICLVMFDDEGKIDRLSYVSEWDELFQTDLFEHLKKDGVLDYAAEYHMYFDERSGRFGEFLVEEGSQIQQGDPLYTYEVRNFAETRRALEQKVQQLREEISSVETALRTIESAPVNSETLSIMFPDETGAMEVPQGSAEADMLKAQFIAEQEKELGQLQAKLGAVEAEMSAVNAQEAEVTVMSPYNGRIINRSVALDNPLLTIGGEGLLTKGILTEEERAMVEADMDVEVHVTEQQKVLDGSFLELSKDPAAVALEEESRYPFTVNFETEETDENEGDTEEYDKTEQHGETETGQDELETTEEKEQELLPGYHAQLYITLNEALDTLVANKNWLQGESIWVMTTTGTLKPEIVDRGLEMNELVQITGDVENGNWVAVEESTSFYPDSVFVTPFKAKRVQWSNAAEQVNWKEYIVTGLLSR